MLSGSVEEVSSNVGILYGGGGSGTGNSELFKIQDFQALEYQSCLKLLSILSFFRSVLL